MAVARDPEKAQFYVYHLVADGIPFYVCIGRSARASDSVRQFDMLCRERNKQSRLSGV